MEIVLLVCPHPHRKPDYQLTMEVPALPQPGDYVTVRRTEPMTAEVRFEPDATGRDHPQVETFVVKRLRWDFSYPDNGRSFDVDGNEPIGRSGMVGVEVVPAKSYWAHPRFNAAIAPNGPEFDWG